MTYTFHNDDGSSRHSQATDSYREATLGNDKDA
jgi:hypothetical protein